MSAGRLRRSQPATHIRVSVTAVYTDVTMPIISTTAKPLTGPVPNMNMITAAITMGIFVGTYSSIYMSTPILVWLGVTSDSFVPTESAVDRQERIARGEA